MVKRKDFRVHLPVWITSAFPEAIWQMPAGEKKVYLTFDDGPIPEVTYKVLDILREHQIKATFFCVGENVYKHPEIFEQIIEEGHSVGNHTYNHLRGIKCSDSVYYANVETANRLIGSNLFRPPHGIMKGVQFRYLSRKYKIIMWDVISCDYDPKLTPEHCFCNVVDFIRDGSIVTFHDSIKAEKNVLGSLPRVIEYLKGEGYSFDKIEFPMSRPFDTSWFKHLHRMRDNWGRARKLA
jgi:peptidoglycan-N-acetylglucosamine deacetylase